MGVDMTEEIKEKAFQLYRKDLKYKDIADELDISVNTFKSWIRRYGWTKNKGAPTTKKLHPKKVGAPKNNKNAKENVGNKKASPPHGNKNALITGEFESIYITELDDDEKNIFDNLSLEPSLVMYEEVKLLKIRQLRMMKRIKETEKGLNQVEKDELFELRGRLQYVQTENDGKKVPIKIPTITKTEERQKTFRKIDDILKLEEALTRITNQLVRTIKQMDDLESNTYKLKLMKSQVSKSEIENDLSKVKFDMLSSSGSESTEDKLDELLGKISEAINDN